MYINVGNVRPSQTPKKNVSSQEYLSANRKIKEKSLFPTNPPGLGDDAFLIPLYSFRISLGPEANPTRMFPRS
ncbi:hypothetical protein CEXT_22271 [Caerostris extrusa]|uniref:Uncharacterized protein n=1 Tax=Caerostris extrusa TaxID=172846 RepID=A0AAV4TLT6_CAEEX|nr:hypothetical protein CEXT_22271 [Caerostris extrusa]